MFLFLQRVSRGMTQAPEIMHGAVARSGIKSMAPFLLDPLGTAYVECFIISWATRG